MTRMFCQGMTSVVPQVPQTSKALAAEGLFFESSISRQIANLRIHHVYQHLPWFCPR